jgi:hypothetical protein
MADYDSDLSLKRIRQWVLASDLNNELPLQPPSLPSRVIDVDPDSSSTDVRLFESHGRRARYIALSHRWGGSRTLTTTTSSLKQRLSGIAWNDVPKTFQNAITITRLLHVRYLWIDSLCIIQDDIKDWEIESSNMASVYQNAYLTIAASSSTGSSSGCLLGFDEISKHDDPSPDERSLGVRISKNSSPRVAQNTESSDRIGWSLASPFVQMQSIYKGTLSRIYITMEWMPSSFKKKSSVYSIPEFGRPVDPIERSELSKRGWVLQERLLSRRTLHFCRDQMYLEDETSILAEDGCHFQGRGFSSGLLIHQESQSWSEHGIPRSKVMMSLIEGYPIAGHRPHGRWQGGWLQYIEDYSSRQLTVPDDKLPALTGVAKMLARNTDDTYYAGLWKSHLPEDLAWRVYPRDEVRLLVEEGFAHEVSGEYHQPKVPARYRAPSWSWASLDARIKFVPLDYAHLVAEVLHCHVDESTPFGKVSGGWLKIWVRD